MLFPRPLHGDVPRGQVLPVRFDRRKRILFPGLGWGLNKIRFGLVGLFLRLTNNWKALEKIHRRRVDAQVGRRNSLRADVGAAGDRQIWRALLQDRSTWPGCGRASRRAPPAWAPSRAASRPLPTCLRKSCASMGVEIRLSDAGDASSNGMQAPGRLSRCGASADRTLRQGAGHPLARRCWRRLVPVAARRLPGRPAAAEDRWARW